MYRKEVRIKINATKFKVIKPTKLKCFGFEVWGRKDDQKARTDENFLKDIVYVMTAKTIYYQYSRYRY